MIQCHFFQSDNRIVGFAINGHDDPDEQSGISLLCAAVSSAVYLTVNAVTDIARVKPLVLETGDGLLTLRLHKDDATACRLLLEGLQLHLQALCEDYETLLTVNITEV